MTLPRTHLFRGWRAALVAAVAACAAPSTAQAVCGDYVVIRDAADTPAADHTAPAAPAPCHGPSCHGSPVRTPLAPVDPPTVTSPKDAVPLGDDEPPADVGPRFPRPTSDACPGGTAAGVFHPPRAG